MVLVKHVTARKGQLKLMKKRRGRTQMVTGLQKSNGGLISGAREHRETDCRKDLVKVWIVSR